MHKRICIYIYRPARLYSKFTTVAVSREDDRIGAESRNVFQCLFSMHPSSHPPPFLNGIPTGQGYPAIPHLSESVMAIPFPWPVPNPGDVGRPTQQLLLWQLSSYLSTSRIPRWGLVLSQLFLTSSVTLSSPSSPTKPHPNQPWNKWAAPFNLHPTFSPHVLLPKPFLPKSSLLQGPFYIFKISGVVQERQNWFWGIFFEKYTYDLTPTTLLPARIDILS